MSIEIRSLNELNGTILLDVREVAEFTSGCYKDAVNVPLSKLKLTVEVMQEFDKSHTYVLYCLRGMRAREAAMILRDGGFKNVCLLDRGYA